MTNLIPKRAIELSIEGGYEIAYNMSQTKGTMRQNEIALDPEFWSALGKSLGWDEEVTSSNFKIDSMSGWEHYALWFTHLILTGGNTESFWAELLR